VEIFEKAFAKRHDVQFALATSSCTTALHLILTALGIGPGDEVIVPAFTWSPRPMSSSIVGDPCICRRGPNYFNIDAGQVSAKINQQTKAIIPVHLFGLCADMDALTEAALGVRSLKMLLVRLGCKYKGCSAGSLGIAGAFPFILENRSPPERRDDHHEPRGDCCKDSMH